MKKNLLILILPLFSNTLLGQDEMKENQIPEVEGRTINNSLTNEHVAISGTKFSLIPPAGFIKASNFLGFQQQESGSSILINEIPGSFEVISIGLTKESMLSKGMEVKKMETFTFNTFPAILVSSIQHSNGTIFSKYSIFYGSNEQVWIINGTFPEALKEIGKEVVKSILTLHYDADKVIDPLESIGFEMNASNSKLIFAKVVSNSLVFSNDGNFPPVSQEKTNLIVSRSISNNSIEDRKLYCLNRIKTMPFEITSTDSVNDISIDGISGYEIIASGQNVKKKEEIRIYQVILFSDNLYYIILAYTNQNFEENLSEFKKLARTFKRR